MVKVWKQSKILFLAIVVFTSFQVLFSVKRVQNFPFFIYDMYSRTIDKPEVFTVYEIKLNGITTDYSAFTNTKESFFLSQIQAYESNLQSYPFISQQEVLDDRFKNKVSPNTYQFIKTGLSNDPSFIKEFPIWLNRNFLQTNHSFTVEKNTYSFNGNKLISSKTILKSDAN